MNWNPRVSLLDALREHLGLTGTKKGCDHGQCGACTIHINGRRLLSCLTLALQVAGKDVTTIEGLASDETSADATSLSRSDGLQGGYCTAGQILPAVGCVREGNVHPELRNAGDV